MYTPSDQEEAMTFFSKKPGNIPVLLANYYEMENRTRDVLIALPGLTLVTERYGDALKILQEVAHHFKDGLLPDRLPLPGQSLKTAIIVVLISRSGSSMRLIATCK